MNEQIKYPEGTVFGSIGQPIRRKEDARLLTGKGRFTDDFSLPGQTYAAMVRSPYAHARIVKIDTAAAKAMPGVLLVLTGADCKADDLKPIPHSPVPQTHFDMKLTARGGKPVFPGRHMLLPADKARHAGEAVAMVVAETRNQAMDAAEAVEVEYEELPFVVRSRGRTQAGPRRRLGRDAGQRAGGLRIRRQGKDRQGIRQGRPCGEGDVQHRPRHRGADGAARSARRLRHGDRPKHALLRRRRRGEAERRDGRHPRSAGGKVRVLEYDIGGNFGSRNRPYVEYGLVVWAAGKIKRPVKFTATRSECFISDYQGRDLITHVEVAFDQGGKMLAMRADNISNVGAHCVSLSPLSKGSGLITGGYDIPAATLRSRAVFTNTMSTNAYRSSGRPEVTFAIERLMDKAADQLGIDRIRLRRKNLVKPKRCRTATPSACSTTAAPTRPTWTSP